MTMTQENITSIGTVNPLDTQAFSSDTRSAVMDVVDIAYIRSKYEQSNKSANGVFAFIREILSRIGIEPGKTTIQDASELIRMRTAIAANDPTFLQQANGK